MICADQNSPVHPAQEAVFSLSPERTLTLLSREWCHLCHDMQAQLEPHAAQLGFAIQVLDVDEDPALEAQWDELVPVLLLNGHEICHYFLDLSALYKACGSIFISPEDNCCVGGEHP